MVRSKIMYVFLYRHPLRLVYEGGASRPFVNRFCKPHDGFSGLYPPPSPSRKPLTPLFVNHSTVQYCTALYSTVQYGGLQKGGGGVYKKGGG